MVKKDDMKGAVKYAPEAKETIIERMREAKGEGKTFKAFFDEVSAEFPSLKGATAYQWWQNVSAAGAEGLHGSATVSDRLAVLLRKEGAIEARIKSMQQQLDAVRAETTELWAKRG